VLRDRELVAFLATERADSALRFYRDLLGLRLVSEDGFALVFQNDNALLRIQKVEQHRPHPYTALGWRVLDIEETTRELARSGVTFERYPGLEQDSSGVWTAPSGARIAWFKDPDGNVLSLSQLPAEPDG